MWMSPSGSVARALQPALPVAKGNAGVFPTGAASGEARDLARRQMERHRRSDDAPIVLLHQTPHRCGGTARSGGGGAVGRSAGSPASFVPDFSIGSATPASPFTNSVFTSTF